MFDYDEEIPRGYQEALHKRGICTHGWMLGAGHIYSLRDIEEDRKRGKFPDRRIAEEDIADALDPPKGKCLCLDCGAIVDDPLAGRY